MPPRPVQRYMTANPECIRPNETLATAHAIMREMSIRHLPVLEGEQLIGIVSQRDLHLIETLEDVDPNAATVEEAMTDSPYCVSPDTSVEEVVFEMYNQKLGSAVIVEASRVVGVFTRSDALKVLLELLKGD
jgi:acetoin utilization protein AcuB